MEIRTTAEVEGLFSQYEKLFQQSDYRSIAKLYGNKIIAADPNRIEFYRNNMITRWQFEKSMRSFYSQAGLTSMKILRLHEYKINEQYSLARISWVATFRKTHSQPLEFHVTYLVRKRKNRAEIVLFIAHEDEKKVLQGYGLIP